MHKKQISPYWVLGVFLLLAAVVVGYIISILPDGYVWTSEDTKGATLTFLFLGSLGFIAVKLIEFLTRETNEERQKQVIGILLVLAVPVIFIIHQLFLLLGIVT